MTPAQKSPQNSAEKIDPTALSLEQAARLLSAAGGTISEDLVRRHVQQGLPTNADGRINLVTYAAWLNREEADAT